jgi:hypothetical protein
VPVSVPVAESRIYDSLSVHEVPIAKRKYTYYRHSKSLPLLVSYRLLLPAPLPLP